MSGLSGQPLDQLHVEFGTRPSMPALEGVTADQRQAGRHLAAIHRSHLRDMGQIAQVLNYIANGTAEPAALQQALERLPLAENMRQFGALCGRECQVLNFHHDAEESSMFPQLEAAGLTELNAVVARLKEEHLVVHELLDRLGACARTLANSGDPVAFAQAKATFEQLHSVVISHFGYEETELEEALGVYANRF